MKAAEPEPPASSAADKAKPEAKKAEPSEPKSPTVSAWRKDQERLLQQRQAQLLQEHHERIQREFEAQQQQMAYGYAQCRPAESLYGTLTSRCGGRPISRIHSFNTLPRREQLDVEGLYGLRPPPNDFVTDRAASRMSMGVGPDLQRARSVMSHLDIGLAAPQKLMESRYEREIIDWNALSLSACLQALFGVAVVCLSVARLMVHGGGESRADDLLNGLSAVVAAVFGWFAARGRAHTMTAWYYAHSALNTLLAAWRFVHGTLPLLPYVRGGAALRQLLDSDQPLEIDLSLVMLCALELATALVVTLHGCRAMGRTVQVLEEVRARLRRVSLA